MAPRTQLVTQSVNMGRLLYDRLYASRNALSAFINPKEKKSQKERKKGKERAIVCDTMQNTHPFKLSWDQRVAGFNLIGD